MKLKKWETDILYYVSIVVFCITYLTFFGDEWSWSENALNYLNSLLNAALFGIAIIFVIVQYAHPMKEYMVYRVHGSLGGEWKLKNFASAIAKGFMCIAIFSLNTELFPEWLHMVATGTSVFFLAMLVAGYFKMWSVKWWVFTTTILISGVCLAVAFIFYRELVKFPEFALAVTGLLFLATIRPSK